MTPETQNCADILCGHLRGMTYRARRMSPAQFDWTPAPPAPTARILVTHALQWLVCDRYHIEEPDAARHARVPDAPADQMALCDALDAETAQWQALLASLTDAQMAETRHQFNSPEEWSVRGSVYHMVQNCIYKHGQLSTLFFALGLDGTEAYDAPFPNPIYEEVFGSKEAPPPQ